MSGFESPNFKKQVLNQNKPLREFTVGASDSVDNRSIEELAREARAANLSMQEQRISPFAKQRVEILADIGRLTKDVQIGEYLFSLRTLKKKENDEALLLAMSESTVLGTQIEAGLRLRKHQLAKSIYKINNEDVKIILENSNILELLDNSEEIVFNMLYNAFNELNQEVKNKFGLNTDKDVQEVSDGLKK